MAGALHSPHEIRVASRDAIPRRDCARCRAAAAARLTAAGAHDTVDGVADLLPVVAAIEGRLARGERP